MWSSNSCIQVCREWRRRTHRTREKRGENRGERRAKVKKVIKLLLTHFNSNEVTRNMVYGVAETVCCLMILGGLEVALYFASKVFSLSSFSFSCSLFLFLPCLVYSFFCL